MSIVDRNISAVFQATPLQLRRLLKLYAQELKASPGNIEILSKTAEVLNLLGRKKEAISLYCNVAWKLGMAGNLGPAISVCKHTLELDPDNVTAQKMLEKLFACKEVRTRKHGFQVARSGSQWVVVPSESESDAPSSPGYSDASRDPAPELEAARKAAALAKTELVDCLVSYPEETPSARPSQPPSEDPEAATCPTEKQPFADLLENAQRHRTEAPLPDEQPAAPPAQLSSRRRLLRPTAPPLEPLADLEQQGAADESTAAPHQRPTLVGYLLGSDFEQRKTTPHPRATRRYPAVQAKTDSEKNSDANLLEPLPELEPATPAHLDASESTSAETPELKRRASSAATEDPPARAGQPLDKHTIDSLLCLDAQRGQEVAAVSPPPPAVSSYRAIQQAVRQDGALLGQVEDHVAESDLDADPPEIPEQAVWDDETENCPECPGEAMSGDAVQLAHFPLFSHLERLALVDLVRTLESRAAAAGELIFAEDDPGDSLYLVVSGSLEVFKVAEGTGQEIRLARLSSGSFFGEFGLLTDRRRHASVRCLDDCELLELKRPALEKLIQTHPSIAWTLRTFYQQRVMSMVMATSPLFLAVNPHERAEVLSRFSMQRFFENELIIQEGQRGSGFYVLLAGAVEVSCSGEAGQRVTLGSLAEGDYFGEMSLLSGNPAQASVKALGISEVLVLSARDFYELSAAHPEIWSLVQEESERRYEQNSLLLERHPRASGEMCLI